MLVFPLRFLIKGTMEYVKTQMTIEEFCRFQKETGLTDEKIRTMKSYELEEALDKYRKQKEL